MISKKSVQQNKKKKKIVKKPPEENHSPTLPRGQYNLDFLNDINPFVSRDKLESPANSDENININPFQTKNKIASSPLLAAKFNHPDSLNNPDPFLSKTNLSHSPNQSDDRNIEENGNTAVSDDFHKNEDQNLMTNDLNNQKEFITDEKVDNSNEFSHAVFDNDLHDNEVDMKNVDNCSSGWEEVGLKQEFSSDTSYSKIPEDYIKDVGLNTKENLDVSNVVMRNKDDEDDDDEDLEFTDALSNEDELLQFDDDLTAKKFYYKENLVTKNSENLNVSRNSFQLEQCESDIPETVLDSIEMYKNLKTNRNNLPNAINPSEEDINLNLSESGIDVEDKHMKPYDASLCINKDGSQEILEKDKTLETDISVGYITDGNAELSTQKNKELLSFEKFEKPEYEMTSESITSSPNLCEDSGIGESIMTSCSEDLGKVDDTRSEEGMDSLPISPSDNCDLMNLAISSKNEICFDEKLQPEAMIIKGNICSSENGEKLHSENDFENGCSSLEVEEESDQNVTKELHIHTNIKDNILVLEDKLKDSQGTVSGIENLGTTRENSTLDYRTGNVPEFSLEENVLNPDENTYCTNSKNLEELKDLSVNTNRKELSSDRDYEKKDLALKISESERTSPEINLDENSTESHSNTNLRKIDTSDNSQLSEVQAMSDLILSQSGIEENIYFSTQGDHSILSEDTNEFGDAKTKDNMNYLEDRGNNSGAASNENEMDDIVSEKHEQSNNFSEYASDKSQLTDKLADYTDPLVTINKDNLLGSQFDKQLTENVLNFTEDITGDKGSLAATNKGIQMDRQLTGSLLMNLTEDITGDREPLVDSDKGTLLESQIEEQLTNSVPANFTKDIIGDRDPLVVCDKGTLLESQIEEQFTNSVPANFTEDITGDKDPLVVSDKGTLLESQIEEPLTNSVPANFTEDIAGDKGTLLEYQIEEQFTNSVPANFTKGIIGDKDPFVVSDKGTFLESQIEEQFTNSVPANFTENITGDKDSLVVSVKGTLLESQIEEQFTNSVPANFTEDITGHKDPLVVSDKGTLLESQIGEQFTNSVPANFSKDIIGDKDPLVVSDKGILLESQIEEQFTNSVPANFTKDIIGDKDPLVVSDKGTLSESQIEEQFTNSVPANFTKDIIGDKDPLVVSDKGTLSESQIEEQFTNSVPANFTKYIIGDKDPLVVSDKGTLLESEIKEQFTNSVPTNFAEDITGHKEPLIASDKGTLLESQIEEQLTNNVPTNFTEDITGGKEPLVASDKCTLLKFPVEIQFNECTSFNFNEDIKDDKDFLVTNDNNTLLESPIEKNIGENSLESDQRNGSTIFDCFERTQKMSTGTKSLVDTQTEENDNNCLTQLLNDDALLLVGANISKSVIDDSENDKSAFMNSVSQQRVEEDSQNDELSHNNDTHTTPEDFSVAEDKEFKPNELSPECIDSNTELDGSCSLIIPSDCREIMGIKDSLIYCDITENLTENQLSAKVENYENNFDNVIEADDSISLKKKSSFDCDKDSETSGNTREVLSANFENLTDKSSTLASSNVTYGMENYDNFNKCSDSISLDIVKKLSETQKKEGQADIIEYLSDQAMVENLANQKQSADIDSSEGAYDLSLGLYETNKTDKSPWIEYPIQQSLGNKKQSFDIAKLLVEGDNKMNTGAILENQRILEDVKCDKDLLQISSPQIFEDSDSNNLVKKTGINQNPEDNFKEPSKDSYNISNEYAASFEESADVGNDTFYQVSTDQCPSEKDPKYKKEFKKLVETNEKCVPIETSDLPVLETNQEFKLPKQFEKSQSNELANSAKNKTLDFVDSGIKESSNQINEDLPTLEGYFNNDSASVFASLIIGSQRIASAILGPSAVCPPVLNSVPLQHLHTKAKETQKQCIDSLKATFRLPSDSMNVVDSSGHSFARTSTSDDSSNGFPGSGSSQSPSQNSGRVECNEEHCISGGKTPAEETEPDTKLISMKTTNQSVDDDATEKVFLLPDDGIADSFPAPEEPNTISQVYSEMSTSTNSSKLDNSSGTCGKNNAQSVECLQKPEGTVSFASKQQQQNEPVQPLVVGEPLLQEQPLQQPEAEGPLHQQQQSEAERPFQQQQKQQQQPEVEKPLQQHQQQSEAERPLQQQQPERPLQQKQQEQPDTERSLQQQQQQPERPLQQQLQQQPETERSLQQQQQSEAERPLQQQHQQPGRPLQQQQVEIPLQQQQQPEAERPLQQPQQQQQQQPQQPQQPLQQPQQQQPQQPQQPLQQQQPQQPLQQQQPEVERPLQQQQQQPEVERILQQQQQQPEIPLQQQPEVERPLQQQQQPEAERPLQQQQQQPQQPLQQQQPEVERPLQQQQPEVERILQQQQQQPEIPLQQQQQQPEVERSLQQQQQPESERPLQQQQPAPPSLLPELEQSSEQQPQQQTAPTKPVKKKLKGKVLKKKVPPKFPGAANWKVQDGDDDIKIMISEKKPSPSTAETPSNIGVDQRVSSPVGMVSSYPEQSPPIAELSHLKEKPIKKSLSKLVKKNKDKIPVVQVPPQINGQDLAYDAKIKVHPSPSSPFKCIPQLKTSLSLDSYPEMAPDFVTDDTDSHDIANEGFVPASEVFNESTAWEMLEKFGEEGNFKDSDQAPQLVYMKLEPHTTPSPSAGAIAAGMLDSAGSQHITNGERGGGTHGTTEGNEFRQMTSSEPSNKANINKIYRHHPNRSLDAKSGGGGTAAMKKREFDNVDNMSFSQKEEKFDKEEKETDDLEFYHDARDFPPAMGDSWVEQIHNFTEIEDSSIGLSQDSLEGLSWSHTDSGLVLDSPLPYGCCFDETNLNMVNYEANKAHEKWKEMGDSFIQQWIMNNYDESDSGVAVETASSHHSSQGANGTEAIVQLVPDSGKQQPSSSDASQVLKYSQSEWNKMKQEQELEFQTRLLQKEKDWSKRLAEKERRITDHEKKIMLLDDQCRNLKQSNEDMRLIVAEFEKTISQLQAEKEKSKSASQESMETLIRERDQALEDLQSVETAFSDLHRRYEKTKNVVEGFKKNEEILKKCVQDYQQKISRAEQKLAAIRQQAEDKLEKANSEIDKVRRSTSAEIAKLEAALRKSEVQVQSMERTIEQKALENQELTAICDELIVKVGDVS